MSSRFLKLSVASADAPAFCQRLFGTQTPDEDAAFELTDGATLSPLDGPSRGASLSEVVNFTVEIATGVASGLLAAVLYDKVKSLSGSVKIEGREVSGEEDVKRAIDDKAE